MWCRPSSGCTSNAPVSRCRVQEAGDGPPVVLVHGASNAGSSWAQLVARMAGFRCILLDRPGCGLSDRVATRFDDIARLEAFADALIVDVLDALALDTAHVLATSFGGYFALRTAAAHPERVDRLVVYGWPAGAPMARIPFVMRLVNVRVLGRILASIPPNERAVRMILRQAGLARARERQFLPGVDRLVLGAPAAIRTRCATSWMRDRASPRPCEASIPTCCCRLRCSRRSPPRRCCCGARRIR